MLRKRTKQSASTVSKFAQPSWKKGSPRIHPRRFIVAFVTAALFCFILSSSRYDRSKADTNTQRLLRRAVQPNAPHPDGTYDLVILGAGPAGLSAAVFAARSTLSVLVLGSLHGGLLSEATSLENFPGYTIASNQQDSSALQWLQSTQQQAQDWGATFALPGLTAQSIAHGNHSFQVTTELEIYQSRALIVATGASPRRLHLPGEEIVWGTSIHSCANCDGSAYGPDDTVLVVGGGDAAVAATLYLSRIVRQVIVVHRQTDFTRPNNYAAVEQMKASPKIRMLMPYGVTSWILDHHNTLVGAHLEHSSSKGRMEINIQGAFLLIGATPNTHFLHGLVALDTEGFVAVSRDNQETSVPGLFAAGEVVLDRGGYRQAITAAAQGAQAAMDAERWLAQKGWLVTGTTQSDKAIQRRVRETDPPRPGEGCDLTQTECLEEVVHRYPLVVFSKFSCPYCGMALEALGMEGANPRVIDLTYFGPKAHLVQTALAKLTGRRTVPNVFIGGETICGGQETVELHRSGHLKEKLLLAGAL